MQSFFELKVDARKCMQGKKPSVYVVGLVYVALACAISYLATRLSGYADYMTEMSKMYMDVLQKGADMTMPSYPKITPAAGVLTAALLVMSAVLEFGMDSYCLLLARNMDANVKDLFNGFNRFGKVLGLMLLRALIVGALSMLCFVPGIIAFYRYRTATFILLDNPEMSVTQCLAESARQTAGHKMDYFSLDLSFIVWILLGQVISMFTVAPVLDIWLRPYQGISRARFYDRLAGRAFPVGGDQNSDTDNTL